MKLVFASSGNEIEIETRKVAEYYIQQLTQDNKNKFHSITLNNVPEILKKLKTVLSNTNDLFVSKFNLDTFSKFIDIELNQQTLNTIHEVWVKLHHDKPGICTLLEKLGFLQDFKDINEYVHDLESAYKYSYRNYTENIWWCDNPFDNSILDFNEYQIKIKANNLGRSTFGKWRNYDENVKDIDTSDFQKISGQLMITLDRPYHADPPKEYIEWCNKHNVKPINGEWLGFGNFVGDINTIRKTWLNNNNDNFFFKT